MWMQGGVEEGERLDAEAAKHLLRRAGQMLRPYRRQCIVALVMVVVWTGTTLAGPFLVKYGIDQGIKADDGGALNAAVVGYVVVAGISYVAYRFQVLLISRIGESFLRDLRLRVFDHLQRLSMPFYDREKAGIIVSRMTSDVDSLQELVQMGLLMFVSNGLLLVVSVIVLAIVSWELLLLCMICVPFVVLASIRFQRESNAAYLDVRDGIGDTLSQLQEGIAGVRVVQAFGREDVESARFQLGQPAPVRRPHALGEDLGLVPARHRAGRAAHHRHRGRHRRLVGAHRRADRRHGHLLHPHALQPLRADPAALAAVQHRAVRRRGAEQAVRACSTRRSTSPSARAPSTCPPGATSWSKGWGSPTSRTSRC